MKREEIPKMCRIYRMLLMVYPKRHQQDYTEAMLQLFHDQCRDAARQDAGTVAFWRRTLLDLLSSAVIEHLSNLTNPMRTVSINRISHLLFAAAIILALLTSPSISGPRVATVFVYLSLLAIFARAVAEWFRPAEERLKAIGWGCAVLVVYGYIMPFWGKLHMMYGDAMPRIPFVLLGAIFLNPIVPLLKAVLARMPRVGR